MQIADAPIRYFSAHPKAGTLIKYRVADKSPVFWEDMLLILVRRGSGIINVNSAEYDIKENSFILTSGADVFFFAARPSHPLELDVIVFPCQISSLFDSYPAISDASVYNGYRPACIQLYPPYDAEVAGAFADYSEQSERADNCGKFIQHNICARLQYLFFHLVVDFGLRRDRLCRIREPKALAVYEYTANNSIDISIEMVMEKFSMTKNQINICMHKICGSSFNYAVNRLRIFLSTALFLREMTYEEIAANCNFTSQSVYFRTFRKYLGCTPEQFRQRLIDSVYQKDEAPVSSELVEIYRYIAENFKEPISIESCSKALYISEHQINKILGASVPPPRAFPPYSGTIVSATRRRCSPLRICS